LDFGIFVERRKNEIFKLDENWMKFQSAVYSGQLANVPEHAHIKRRDKFMKMVMNRFISVKVSQIVNNSIELLLLNP